MITAGRVSINGDVVTTLGTRADLGRDEIRVDDRRVTGTERRRYLLVNKPAGYVTTRNDPEGRRTVLDLLPRIREYVYPVGRLDYESEGLLLVTNDGELAASLTHPRHRVERVYEAVVTGVPGATKMRKLGAGVVLDGRRTAPAEVRMLGGHKSGRDDHARIRVVLREGRNRQVRRMFEAIGHPVQRLRRTQLGPISIRGLQRGKARELTRDEVDALKRAISSPLRRPEAKSPKS